jgi:hypothetical protein
MYKFFVDDQNIFEIIFENLEIIANKITHP